MTGHDLDLDAIESRSRDPEPEDVPALVAEIESLNRQLDTPPWTTVDMLTAKLAAAEQERDEACESANHANASADRFRHHAARAEAALAAVQDHGHAAGVGDGRVDWFAIGVELASRYSAAALAAAEQPEPERTRPCSRCNGSGSEPDPCCGHVTVLGAACPDACCVHGPVSQIEPTPEQP